MKIFSCAIPVIIVLLLFGLVNLANGESAKQLAERCEGKYNSCSGNVTSTYHKCLDSLKDKSLEETTCNIPYRAANKVCSDERNKCYNDPDYWEGKPDDGTDVRKPLEDVLNPDCSVKQDVFDRDWEKYSDIDTVPDDFSPLTLRSLEAQKYFNTKSKIRDLKKEIILLKRDLEIGRLMRAELRGYRQALVKNLKANLVKAFIRLAYITYDIVKGTPGLSEGAVGTGKTFMKLFDTEVHKISKIGATLKVLKDITPKDSVFSMNTENITGKVNSVVLTGQLETLDNLFDPKEVGKAVVQDIIKQALPSPDLTQEEINILKTQHLNKRIIDDVIQESYRVNFERRDRVKALMVEIADLKKEVEEWKNKEKDRVKNKLERSCGGNE